MGSPLSPILADIVMDDLETHCLSNLDCVVNTFYRYMDDIFLIILKTKLDSVLLSFNSYHPRLKFTCELECNNILNFLNTSVIRTDSGLLTTNWYRKPTFSGRYINFFSNHPLQYKINTIKNLVDHAILLSDAQFHTENLQIVKSILINNGYPNNILIKEINSRYKFLMYNRLNSNINTESETEVNKNYTMTIPYICNVSEDVKRIWC